MRLRELGQAAALAGGLIDEGSPPANQVQRGIDGISLRDEVGRRREGGTPHPRRTVDVDAFARIHPRLDEVGRLSQLLDGGRGVVNSGQPEVVFRVDAPCAVITFHAQVDDAGNAMLPAQFFPAAHAQLGANKKARRNADKGCKKELRQLIVQTRNNVDRKGRQPMPQPPRMGRQRFDGVLHGVGRLSDGLFDGLRPLGGSLLYLLQRLVFGFVIRLVHSLKIAEITRRRQPYPKACYNPQSPPASLNFWSSPAVPFLYSTNTLLVYRLTLQYLNGRFRVYCTDAFDASYNPGHSNPKAIYHLYQHIASSQRFDHPKVQQILEAMVGAAMQAPIPEAQRAALVAELQQIRARQDCSEFAPLLYLIDAERISPQRVQVFRGNQILGGTASAIEYLIDDLRPPEFSVVPPGEPPTGS